MDHNLEDELNLESAMGVDFDHTEDVTVSHTDISLGTNSHDTDMAMEFEHIEEQPMLMDTSNEEVIEFMGDQFSLQSYTMSDNETTGTSAVISEQQNASESLVDLQFEQPIISTGPKQDFQIQSKLVAVKSTIPSRIVSKKIESSVLPSVPRQIAIAPKPPPKAIQTTRAAFGTKQFAIAPKPMTLVGSKTFKKVSLANLVPGNVKGTTVFGQMGKQLIMVPASGTQKIKVIAANTGASTIQYIKSNSDQAQLIATKNLQTTKPVLAKVIVQGQDPSNQPAVITKILPAASSGQTRYVMQQKTVTVGNKVVTSPTKSPTKVTKTHEIITTPKLMPVQTPGTTTKKVVITSNPKQNLVLKTTAAPKSLQTIKGSVVSIQGQQSQIHQVHVPGKGVQYIRLLSNPASPTKSSASAKAQEPPPKSFVFTDSKGNLIQMTAEKIVGAQPPPLVLTTAGASKTTSKPRQKLVRIAPLTSQSQQVMPIIRSTQSLLAPLTLEEMPASEEETEPISEDYPSEDQPDSKEALRAMIAETVPEDMLSEEIQHGEVEVQFERQESEVEDNSSNNLEHLDSSNHSDEHPLIVIPSNFIKQHEQNNQLDDGQSNNNHILDIEIEGLPSYERSQTPQQVSDSETAPNEQDLTGRPRKACNCTKSQCLKLYCDCFANGEFCNRCNCNNCHNNLENEELRQKAIRGCLERNPNAFRPKIGKSKTGGPEIIRRHNKGCNCKRSGCLKNYCECYEAKIACSSICKCVGCRNVEETLERGRRREPLPTREVVDSLYRPAPCAQLKSPSSFMTNEVIEAVCQCLLAAAVSGEGEAAECEPPDPVRDVLDEFARCLQDIISAAHLPPASALDEGHA